MIALIKVMIIMALFFASTFVLLTSTGIVTVAKIEHWLTAAQTINLFYVGLIITALLLADLFIAVPTLTVMILAGFFLGHFFGAMCALIGLILAGCSGYWVSRMYGDRLLNTLIKDPNKRQEAMGQFRQHGAMIILLSRATPILPEVSACMSGMTNMPFLRFFSLWLLSITPYALIATYAGSISSIQNPKPAIFTAIALTLVLWLAWFIMIKVQKRKLRTY